MISGLAETYRERRYLPRVRRVSCNAWADYVSDEDIATMAEGYGAVLSSDGEVG